MTDPEPTLEPEPAEDQLLVPSQTPLYRASQGLRYQRQQDILTIERFTRRRLICYVASPSAFLLRTDISGFVDLAHDLRAGDEVDVMISTYGGDPEAAFRIAYLLRKAVGTTGTLNAVIPDSAKSAGTILAAGMDTITMSDSSELGPVDPLVKVPLANGQQDRRPALTYIAAYEDAVARASTADASAPVWDEIRRIFDPTTVLMCRQAVAATRDILEKLLSNRAAPGALVHTQVAGNLLSVSRRTTHGGVITADEARTIGLDVTYLDRNDPLWQAYWRLHCLQVTSLAAPIDRLFESSRISLPICD